MQLFMTHQDLQLSAQDICSKHLIKQILEAAQVLSAAHHLYCDCQPAYKLTHKRHPIVKYTTTNQIQYVTTLAYALECCYEYTRRYGRIHKSQDVIVSLMHTPIRINKIGYDSWDYSNMYRYYHYTKHGVDKSS